MRSVAAVTANQVLRFVADRQGALLLLAIPLVLNLILGVSLKRVFSPDFRPERPYRVIVVDAGNPAAAAVRTGLRAAEDEGWLRVTTADDPEKARRAIGRREAVAAVIVPADFPHQPALVVAEPGAVVAATAMNVVREAVSRVVDPESRAVPVQMTTAQVASSREGPPAAATEYYAVALSVLMVYFAARHGALSYLHDRTSGVYLRVRAAGVSRPAYLLGKFGGSLAVSLAFMILMAAATRLLFDVRWGNLAGWVLLTAAACLAAAGLNTALMALIRAPEVMDGVSAALFQILAFLGGSMMPTFLFPDVLERISRWVPNRWMLNGYLALLGGGGLPDVGEEALRLAVAGLVLFTLGWLVEALATRAVGEA